MAPQIEKLMEKLRPKHPKYFEGILQIRNPTDAILDWMYETLQHDGRALIVEEKRVTNGYDIYLTSQKYVQILGRKLKEKFGGDLKVTATLHTKSRTGKDLYRVTVLYRVFPFNVGDTFDLDGRKVEIVRFDKQIQVKDVLSGKRFLVKYEFVERNFV